MKYVERKFEIKDTCYNYKQSIVNRMKLIKFNLKFKFLIRKVTKKKKKKKIIKKKYKNKNPQKYYFFNNK